MEFYTFFVFFSVIVTPDGEIKSFARHVEQCPTWEVVKQLHEPKVASGEIIDWGATCLEPKLPLKMRPSSPPSSSEEAVPYKPTKPKTKELST